MFKEDEVTEQALATDPVAEPTEAVVPSDTPVADGPAEDAGSEEAPAVPAEDTGSEEAPAVPAEDTGSEEAPVAPAEVPEDPIAVARVTLKISDDLTDAQVTEVMGLGTDITQWSTQALLWAIQGKVGNYPETSIKDLIHVYRQRVEVPTAWAEQQVLEFLRTGKEPSKTSKGVWVVDVTRPQRLANEWTTAELESWALGDIRAGGRNHDNGLALELKARLSLKCEDSVKAVRKAYRGLDTGTVKLGDSSASQPVVVPMAKGQTLQLQQSRATAAQIEKVEGLSTMSVAIIDDGLRNYIATVKPGQVVSEADGLRAQNALDTLLQYVVSLDTQGMVSGLERIKAVFKQQLGRGGVFEASGVFRFTHLMRAENNRRARHIALLELMRIYFADAPEARKQCDVRALLQYQPADKLEILVEYFTKRA